MSEIVFHRILFFSLIPIGIILLIKGIKLVRKSFFGTVLLNLPYLKQSGTFTITTPGKHAIWYKGPLYRKIPSDKFRPRIFDAGLNIEIDTSFSIIESYVNGFSEGRIEAFTFDAPAGNYRMELAEGGEVPALLKFMSKIIPDIRKVDLEKFYVQVRQSQPRYYAFLAILLILLGAFGIIGGLVLGILADKIFQG